MRKIFLALLLAMPLMAEAQSEWEIPANDQSKTAVKQEAKKKTKHVEAADSADLPYLRGAVPEIDGKVVFTLHRDVPGMSADSIYNRVYAYMEMLIRQPNQHDISRIALVNKSRHIIAARMKEDLVFSSSFLSLDRTVFNYMLIATCTDQHLHLTMDRLSYEYEMDRSTGFSETAEELITDKKAVNKKGTKLVRGVAKFRRKTIDRKDDVFEGICKALNIKY